MAKQYMLLEENKYDFEYIDALSVTYEPVLLPENVVVHAEITDEDLAYGLANSTPVWL